MNEYQKLEWLHSQISELKDGVEVDLETMQSFIEDLRESYLEKLRNSNDATEKAKLCPDHDMEFYEFEEDGEYFHGFECSTCGMLQTG